MIKGIFIFIFYIFIATTLLHAINNPILLSKHENWSFYKENDSLIAIARGRLKFISSYKNIDNALLRKHLQETYLGVIYQKNQSPQYFIQFTQSFIDGQYLTEKNIASWQNFIPYVNRKEQKLINQYDSVPAQLTSWLISPFIQKNVTNDEQERVSNSFIEIFLCDWTRTGLRFWLNNFHTNKNNLSSALNQDLFHWLADGINVNKKESLMVDENLDNLYWSTTLDNLIQQPSFSIDFGIKHIEKVLTIIKNYQQAYFLESID